MAVSIHADFGRFDLCRDKKEFRLTITTEYGRASAFFDEDPGLHLHSSVEDVVDAIERRLSDYLYISGKEETLRVIAQIRANLPQCELEQHRKILAFRKANFERAEQEFRSAERIMAMLEKDAASTP